MNFQHPTVEHSTVNNYKSIPNNQIYRWVFCHCPKPPTTRLPEDTSTKIVNELPNIYKDDAVIL